MAAVKKQCFFAFSVLIWVFTYRHSMSGGFTNEYEFRISVMSISSKQSN